MIVSYIRRCLSYMDQSNDNDHDMYVYLCSDIRFSIPPTYNEKRTKL